MKSRAIALASAVIISLYTTDTLAQFTPSSATLVLPNIAALQALGVGAALNPNVQVLGYYAKGDGFVGNYVWNPSSTTTTTVCGPFAEPGVSTGRYILQQPVSARGCGAKGDGSTNDGVALNVMLATGGPVVAEAGNYFTSQVLNVASSDTMTCLPGAKFSFDASGGFYLFTINTKSHVKVTGKCNVTNTTSAGSAVRQAFGVFASTDVTIEGVTTVGTGLAMNDSTSGTGYSGVTTGNINYDINYLNNIIGNSATSGIANAGLVMQYTNGFKVIGNTVSGTNYGIYWWGGDANTDGALGNIRWATNGTVDGNNVHDIARGCVWGSMGQGIISTGNTVANCGDVGFDDEGGVNVSFVGGSATNCTNGCLTTFFKPTGTLFKGVAVNQTSSSTPIMYRSYNSTLDPGTTSVTLDGNMFNYTGDNSAQGLVDNGNGPVGSMIVSNNTFINSKAAFTSSNAHDFVIQGNHFQYTVKPSSPFFAIDVENYLQYGSPDAPGIAKVMGNDFSSFVAQDASTYMINLVATDANATSFGFIQNNQSHVTTAGDIQIQQNVSNSGVHPIFDITGNSIRGVYNRVETGAGTSIAMLVGNVDQAATAYPGVGSIGSMCWDLGQVFTYRPPTAGGFIGKVETTAGCPGTQKDFGAVQP